MWRESGSTIVCYHSVFNWHGQQATRGHAHTGPAPAGAAESPAAARRLGSVGARSPAALLARPPLHHRRRAQAPRRARAARRRRADVPRAASTAATIALAFSVLFFLTRLVFLVQRRLLWRVRRKLILSYIFIGVVPSLLILGFFLLGTCVHGRNRRRVPLSRRLRRRARARSSSWPRPRRPRSAASPRSTDETIDRVQRNGAARAQLPDAVDGRSFPRRRRARRRLARPVGAPARRCRTASALALPTGCGEARRLHRHDSP